VLSETADRDGLNNLADVSSQALASIEHFFNVYKDLEHERTETFGYDGRDAALSLIDESRARYERRSGSPS
jgi:inorganic pyrophosphatase